MPVPAYLVGDFVLVSEDVDKEIMGLRSASCLVKSCSSSPPWVYTVQVPRDRITTESFMSPTAKVKEKDIIRAMPQKLSTQNQNRTKTRGRRG